MQKEAMLYKKLQNEEVSCHLWYHYYRIKNYDFGFCGVRQNQDCTLNTYVYGATAASHVDLKSWSDGYYRETCSGRLKPVLNSIRKMKELRIWLEITTLLIPGENDSQDEMENITEFIAGVDVTIPWHISAFHPS